MPPDQSQSDEVKPSYDFILNTPNQEEPPLSQRFDKMKLAAVAFVVVLISLIGILIMITMQSRAAEQQRAKLTEVAQHQTEIIRLADIGTKEADSSRTKQRAEAISRSVSNSLSETTEMLDARGVQPSEDELAKLKDGSIDAALAKADQFNGFDRAFDKAMEKRLTDYQRSLLAAEKDANTEEYQALEKAYNEANSILGLVDDR